jgi:signal transduction histidine kinase/ActR/RegA family two-component response regulator
MLNLPCLKGIIFVRVHLILLTGTIMKNKGSLVRTIFTGMICIAVVSILLLGILMIHNQYMDFNRASQKLRDEFMSKQESTIKNEVDKAFDYVEYFKSNNLKVLKNSLKSDTDQAYDIAMNICNANKGIKNVGEIKKMVKDALRSIRLNKDNGTFFAIGLDGIVQLSPNRSEMEGLNLFGAKDKSGAINGMTRMIDQARKEKEGFLEYTSKKRNQGENYFPRIAYYKLFEPLNWVICNSSFFDEGEARSQKLALEKLADIKFGSEGCIFVVNYSGKTLINNDQKELVGKDVLDLTDPNGLKVTREARKTVEAAAGGFINYVWNKPGESKPVARIAFVKGFKDWQWIIGASAYIDEIDKIISENRKSLEQRIRNQLIKTASLLLFLLGATWLMAKYISKRVDRSLAVFSTFFQKAAEESTKIDLKGITFSEFEALAISANSMIEKRKTAEQALRENIAEREKLEDRLRQSQKMEAIGTLAGGIAHDFNNVLTPVMGHAEMLMMGLPADSHIQYNLQQIYQACDRAKEMVQQILTFSRKDIQEKAPIRLGQIITDAIGFLRGSLPTTIDIKYNIVGKDDTIFGNSTQIHQVILNLCTNAAHAMREKGGVLTIDLDEFIHDSSVAITFRYAGAGRYLRLKVKDSGPGIDRNIIEKIFEPYFTTKKPGEGTGMGLAVVHGIVMDHKGDIAVESTSGEGTTFTVLFPAYQTVQGRKDVDAQIPTVPYKGNEKILLVDDEKIVIDILQTMLENFGYQVTARTSSIEAFEAFQNNPDRFDLIITDMTMPNMTGKELASKIFSLNPEMPVILCSGFSELIDEESARAMGIKAFIMKPVAIKQLAKTVREVLGKDEPIGRN